MEIPLPQQNDIYSYGFDKSLNRETPELQTPDINMVEKVRDALLQAGIDVNTINGISSGNFSRNDFHWVTLFESLDGFLTQNATLDQTALTLTSGLGGAGANAYITKQPTYPPIALSWGKDRTIKTRLKINQTVTQTIWAVTGDDVSTARHIGFKIVDNTLYGTVADGTTESTVDLGSYDDVHDLKCSLIAGVRVDFFVDDILMGTITTNIPTSGTNYRIIEVLVVADIVATKTVVLSHWDFWQAN